MLALKYKVVSLEKKLEKAKRELFKLEQRHQQQSFPSYPSVPSETTLSSSSSDLDEKYQLYFRDPIQLS